MNNKKEKNEQYIEMIRQRLSEKRFFHSIKVAEKAYHLAVLYGADPEKARTAGLLHDILKELSVPEQLQMKDEFGIMFDTVTEAAPKCRHAVLGEVFLRRELGIDDDDILNAVRYHTTARAGMSKLEKALYLADFTSDDRSYDDVEIMRELVERDCLDAMLYALTYSIRELIDKGAAIHPDTLNAYNEAVLEARRKEWS